MKKKRYTCATNSQKKTINKNKYAFKTGIGPLYYLTSVTKYNEYM